MSVGRPRGCPQTDMNTFRRFILVVGLAILGSISLQAQTSLAGLDGTRVNIESQRGKVVVLAVGASWLPLSDKQAEFTNALARKYAGKNVVFYFVATDSTNPRSKNFASNEMIQKFVASTKLSVPVLRDSDGAATLKQFEVEQLPSFVILDKTGKQAGEAFGGIDPKFDITVPISKVIDRSLAN